MNMVAQERWPEFLSVLRTSWKVDVERFKLVAMHNTIPRLYCYCALHLLHVPILGVVGVYIECCLIYFCRISWYLEVRLQTAAKWMSLSLQRNLLKTWPMWNAFAPVPTNEFLINPGLNVRAGDHNIASKAPFISSRMDVIKCLPEPTNTFVSSLQIKSGWLFHKWLISAFSDLLRR